MIQWSGPPQPQKDWYSWRTFKPPVKRKVRSLLINAFCIGNLAAGYLIICYGLGYYFGLF